MSTETERMEMERIVTAHVATLMEHFDTAQIFVTKQDGNAWATIQIGNGNWYARFGQVVEWVAKERARAVDQMRTEVKADAEDVEEEE